MLYSAPTIQYDHVINKIGNIFLQENFFLNEQKNLYNELHMRRYEISNKFETDENIR